MTPAPASMDIDPPVVAKAHAADAAEEKATRTPAHRTAQRQAKRVELSVEEDEQASDSDGDYAPKSSAAAPLSRSTSQVDLSFWAPAEATKAKGKLRAYADDGSSVRSPMGLNTLEPSNRNGAAARNVTTANGNFAVLEAELAKVGEKIDKLAVDIFERIGGVNQNIGAMDTQVREAIGAFAKQPASRKAKVASAFDVDDSDVEFVETKPAKPAAKAMRTSGAVPMSPEQSVAQNNAAANEMLGLMKLKIAQLERELGIRPQPEFKPTSFTVNTREPDEPQPVVQQNMTWTQRLHAAAALRVPQPGFVARSAPPIEALDYAPQEAELAIVQSHLYDLSNKISGLRQSAADKGLLPEMFLPTMQSAAATAPQANIATVGTKRAFDGASSFASGLHSYEDKEPKRQRTAAYGTTSATSSANATPYVTIGPWGFSAKPREIKDTLTSMFNSLPQSHMLRAPGSVQKCANRAYVVMAMKSVADAELLKRAWGHRGPALAECLIVDCPPDEVPTAFTGKGF